MTDDCRRLSKSIPSRHKPIDPRVCRRRWWWIVRPTSLDLDITPELVRRLKCRFGRAIGMKANQIQSARFGDADDALPVINVCRWMAGFGKDAAFQRAAKKCFAAVDCELRAVGGNLALAKNNFARIALRRLQDDLQMLKCWMKFIPKLHVAAERHFH